MFYFSSKIHLLKNCMQNKNILKLKMANKHIFVSYCHKNKKVVHDVANRLKETYTIWLDDDNLKSGENKDEKIADGVRDSFLFICFISNFYCDSSACTDEFFLAKQKKFF